MTLRGKKHTVTFSAEAGSVHRRAGRVVVAGAGGRATRSVQARWTHGGAVFTLEVQTMPGHTAGRGTAESADSD